MLNSVNLNGRFVKIIKTGTFGSHEYCDFFLAVPRNYKDKDGNYPADFVPVTAFNNRARYIESYVGIGDLISVSGSFHTVSKKMSNGQHRNYYSVLDDNISVLAHSGKNATSGQSHSSSDSYSKVNDDLAKTSQKANPLLGHLPTDLTKK